MPPNIDIAPNTATVKRPAKKTRALRRLPPDAEALLDREPFISPSFRHRFVSAHPTPRLYEFFVEMSTALILPAITTIPLERSA